MNESPLALNPDLVYSLYANGWKPQLVRIALLLDVFTPLAGGPADAHTVASVCDCDSIKAKKGCKMSEKQDFERAWLAKLSACLGEIAGEEIRKEVMQGSEELYSRSGRQEVINWSREAMERLETLVDEEKCKQIMTGCACQYPKSALQEMRKTYEATQDVDLVHHTLQEQFESFLKDTLQLRVVVTC